MFCPPPTKKMSTTEGKTNFSKCLQADRNIGVARIKIGGGLTWTSEVVNDQSGFIYMVFTARRYA